MPDKPKRKTALDKRIERVGRSPPTLENLYLLDCLEAMRREQQARAQKRRKATACPEKEAGGGSNVG